MDYKQIIAKEISHALNKQLLEEEVYSLLEKPKYSTQGDIAFPCFTLAKKLKKSPQLIATELNSKISNEHFDKTEVVGPYVNFFLNRNNVSNHLLKKILMDILQHIKQPMNLKILKEHNY